MYREQRVEDLLSKIEMVIDDSLDILNDYDKDSMEAYYEEMTKGKEVHCVGTRTRKRIRCVICMNSKFTKIKLACGHIYHRKCIDEWARRKPKCPVCDTKLQLVPDKEDKSSFSTA